MKLFIYVNLLIPTIEYNKLGLSWAKLSKSWTVFKLTEFCGDLNLIDLKSDNTSKIYLTKPLTYSLMIGFCCEKKLQSIRLESKPKLKLELVFRLSVAICRLN